MVVACKGRWSIPKILRKNRDCEQSNRMSKMHAIPLNPTPIGFSPEKILGGATHNLNTLASVVVLKARGTQTTFLSPWRNNYYMQN